MSNKPISKSAGWHSKLLWRSQLESQKAPIPRFRSRPGQPEPRQLAGHKQLEIVWTIIPCLILAFLQSPKPGQHPR